MNKIFKYIFILVIVLFCNQASALTLSPIRFELSGDPGSTINEQITLTNETQGVVTYYSSFTNFEAQGETGNPNFVDPVDGLGTWMKTDESITLEPGNTKTIPLTINIPANAEPGGHFAVVFFGTLPKAENGQVGIGANTGVLVLLSVNGDVKEGGGLAGFKVKNDQFWFNTLPVSFEYRFRNDGNDRIKPEGDIRILNSFFIKSKTLDGNPVDGNILPNSTRKFDATWVNHARSADYVPNPSFFTRYTDDVVYQWKNFAFGFYTAKINLSYGTKGMTASGSDTFFVFPWQLLIVIFIVLVIVIWGGRKMIRSYNRYVIEKAKEMMEHERSPDAK